MASMTRTVTAPAAAAVPSPAEIVRSRYRTPAEKAREVAQKLEVLFKTMTAYSSTLLPVENINEWSGEFNQYSLTDPQGQKKASQLLCFLLFDFVEPAIAQVGMDGQKKRALDAIKDQLIQILRLAIPDGETAAGFIEQYRKSIAGESSFHKQCQKVDQAFAEREEQLMRTYSAENALIEQSFNDQRTFVGVRHAARDAAMNQINGQVGALTRRVSNILQASTATAQEAGAVAKKVGDQEQALQSLLGKVKEIRL